MGGSWLWGRHGLASAPTKPMIEASPCDEDTAQPCWESLTFQPCLNSLVIWWRTQSGILETMTYRHFVVLKSSIRNVVLFLFQKMTARTRELYIKEFYSNERILRRVYRWKCTYSSSSLTCYNQKMTYLVQLRQQCEHLPKPNYSTLNTCRTILQHRKMFFFTFFMLHPVAMFLF